MHVEVGVALVLLSNGEWLNFLPSLLWRHLLIEGKGHIIHAEWRWIPTFSCGLHWHFWQGCHYQPVRMKTQSSYLISSDTTPIGALACFITVSWDWKCRFPSQPLLTWVGVQQQFFLWCLAGVEELPSKSLVGVPFLCLLDRESMLLLGILFCFICTCLCFWFISFFSVPSLDVRGKNRKPKGLTILLLLKFWGP